VEDYVSLGSAPLGLVSWENYLYIAESSANTVSVYDLSARKMLKNIHVGFEPARFVTSDGSVYVTNYLDGSISILQGGQFSVSKEVAVGKSARELAVSEKQRLIFVGVGDCDGSLAVVDTTGNHVIGRIELGSRPMGISVIE
jgi:YVTN family beta-propeller protein